MNTLARFLLYPRLRSLANRLQHATPGQRWAVCGAALFLGLVWFGLYAGLVRLLRVCLSLELVGGLLVDRLLALLFISFSGVLLFGNTVVSLATYYLAGDLMLLNAAPVSRLRLFYARLIETLLASSWMVMVFGGPALLAYGTVNHAPWYYYLVCWVVLAAFVLLPANAGVVITSVLVNIFPARRARDLLAIMSALFLAGAWLLLRALKPEQLVSPDSFGDMARFLSSLAVPEAPWLPWSWAVAVLTALRHGESEVALQEGGFLILSVAAFTVLAAWLTTALYEGGWSKTQEGRTARFARTSGATLQSIAALVAGRIGGAILVKDGRLLARDARQWSQLVLLLGLVAIYLFSIAALPFEVLQFDTTRYRNAVAFLNIGMTGFVQAGVATRFVFPSVSAEGRAIWMLRAAPVRASELLRAKWLMGVLPLVLLGLALAVASNWLLDTHVAVRCSAVFTAVLSSLGIAALAAGLGAQLPNFKAEDPVKVAASFGAVVFMGLALVFLLSLVLLQAYPTFLLYAASGLGRPLPDSFPLAAALGFGGCIALTSFVCLVALSIGSRALERRDY